LTVSGKKALLVQRLLDLQETEEKEMQDAAELEEPLPNSKSRLVRKELPAIGNP